MQFIDLVLPEIYRGLTNDPHPDFGGDLAWNPAHGPRGPPLKARGPSTLRRAAGAGDTPMGG